MIDLLGRIEHWAHVLPDRLAHVSGDDTLTYGELARRSAALAGYLAQALPSDRSPVAVIGHKQPEMLIGFLGAVRAGHPYIPLDVTMPEQRIERIVELADVRLRLTPADIARLTRETPGVPPDGLRPVGHDDPYYIMFTSGSTGEPKGVVITLGCLTSFVSWMLDEQVFSEGAETFLNQAPFSFDLSVMDLYCSLASGGTLVSISQAQIGSPPDLYRALARSGATVWVSTPSFARLCLAEKSFTPDMLPDLRRFLFCGETLTPEVAAALIDRFPAAQVWNTYGPTEATVAATSVRVDKALLSRYNPLPVGYVKPGSRIAVFQDGDHLAPDGEQGEIVIAGPGVSPCYLGRPDLTSRSFFELDGMRAYRTGDLGRFQDGLLFWEGRRDSQIKLHGNRIELGDVEAHLQALPGVRDAIILPCLKDGRPEWLAAFVIMADGADASGFAAGQALRASLAERLPAYMIPRKVFFLTAFPMTPNGKADRRKLAEMIP